MLGFRGAHLQTLTTTIAFPLLADGSPSKRFEPCPLPCFTLATPLPTHSSSPPPVIVPFSHSLHPGAPLPPPQPLPSHICPAPAGGASGSSSSCPPSYLPILPPLLSTSAPGILHCLHGRKPTHSFMLMVGVRMYFVQNGPSLNPTRKGNPSPSDVDLSLSLHCLPSQQLRCCTP